MSTETSRILAEHDLARKGNFPYERKAPPGHVLDAMAEQKLMGGYRRKRNALCPECRTLKSNDGHCTCDE